MAASILRSRAAAAASGCRQFASSACLMLQSNKMYSLGEKKVVNINNSSNIEKEFESDFVVGSSHGWVGLLKEEEDRVRCGSSSSLSLWNPMSGSRMKLPPIHTLPHYPNCRLKVEKLMVDDAECSRAIIVGFSNWLGVCCPGGCSEWTLFGRDRQYVDVVACSQSRVYSVDIRSDLVRWNISDPRRPRIEWKKGLYELGYNNDEEEKNNFPRKPDHLFSYRVRHLVYAEHSGQLFVVTRHYVEQMDPHGSVVEDLWNSDIYPLKTVAFDVHLLVENETKGKGKGKVRYMEHSLDGLVMFVGLNNSFAVSAADFPHLNSDSIYFTDHADHIRPKWVDSIYGGHDIGIYDYKNRTISSCYYPSHHQALKKIHPHPFWFTPTSTTLKG